MDYAFQLPTEHVQGVQYAQTWPGSKFEQSQSATRISTPPGSGKYIAKNKN